MREYDWPGRVFWGRSRSWRGTRPGRWAAVVVALLVVPCVAGLAAETGQRQFRFIYGATITDLPQGADVRVWVPLAADGPGQRVRVANMKLPGQYQVTRDAVHGNGMIYLRTSPDERGEVPIEIRYDVTRGEVGAAAEPAVDARTRAIYLRPSRLVPIGEGLARQLMGEGGPRKGAPRTLAREIYDAVGARMRYDKPADQTGWGRGDAQWACDNGFGNCTDFHSLFIAAARSQGIPARFEIGFSVPADASSGEIGGYHCWAFFADGDRWVPVDISEADKHPALRDYYFGRLTPDRVAFSTGRDVVLEPAAAAGPVNFFIYPHVEVNGKTHDRWQKRFRFE